MLVKDWMEKDALPVEKKATIREAVDLMRRYGRASVPVVEEGVFVGLLTLEGLRRPLLEHAGAWDPVELIHILGHLRVEDAMDCDALTVPLDATIEEAAEDLLEKGVDGAPVLDANRRVMGMISQEQILRVLVSLMGVKRKGLQIGLQVHDQPGSIKEVTDIGRKYGCRLVSVMSTIHERSGFRHVYLRVCDCDRRRLERMQEDLKAVAKVLYWIDHGEGHKEVFIDQGAPPAGEWYVG